MTGKRNKILLIGGCDLQSMSQYLNTNFQLDSEFNSVVDGIDIRTSDLCQLINSKLLDEKTKLELCENIPFYHKDITFKTKIFRKDYDVIVLSLVDDYIRGFYIRDNIEIGCAGYYNQEKYLGEFKKEQLDYLLSNFKYIGKQTKERFKEKLCLLLKMIGTNTHVILINGPDIDISDWIGEERVERYRDMNKIVDEVVDNFSNVSLLDLRKIVINKKQLIKKDNRHFDRKTYYLMATELSRLASCLETNSWSFIQIRRFFERVKKRISKLYLRIFKKRHDF